VIDGTDVESIAMAIEELAINHDSRAKMGEAARQWARRHEWSAVVSATLAAINKESGA
jgi:glycosyltransferase involved in cell wall biosynthesis